MRCSLGREKIDTVAEFLRVHGDDLPEMAIQHAVSENVLPNFVLECDENGDLAAAVTYDRVDWYDCTIKYLAVREDLRKRGLGTVVTKQVIENAKADPRCHVLGADITTDNLGSKKIFEDAGFKVVSRFCWAPNEKPADVLHYVKLPPDCTGDKCVCQSPT